MISNATILSRCDLPPRSKDIKLEELTLTDISSSVLSLDSIRQQSCIIFVDSDNHVRLMKKKYLHCIKIYENMELLITDPEIQDITMDQKFKRIKELIG